MGLIHTPIWLYFDYTAALFREIRVRERSKLCEGCTAETPTLYRCRASRLQGWRFLCNRCVARLKVERADTYQYGGTWKRFRR